MLGLVTGRYTVIRGSETNEYGDEVDGTEVFAINVLGSVIEKTKTAFDPASSRVVTLRYLTGRFPSNSGIQDGDRIVDEKTLESFVVSSVYRPTNAVVKSDIVVDLTAN